MQIACVFIILLSLATFSEIQALGQSRSKRSLWNFGLMILCETGRWPLVYNNYGCHCGKGGIGNVALDGVDQCCLNHDNCYKRLAKFGGVCDGWNLYTTGYHRKRCSGCDRRDSRCAFRLCKCDQTAARCFKRNTYNRKMKNIKKRQSNRCRRS